MDKIEELKKVITEKMNTLKDLDFTFNSPVLTDLGRGILQGLIWVYDEIELIEKSKEELINEDTNN